MTWPRTKKAVAFAYQRRWADNNSPASRTGSCFNLMLRALEAIALLAAMSDADQRCVMRSDHDISREKHVRDELALQRRLGAARRAASTLMPTLRRTGVLVKAATSAASTESKCTFKGRCRQLMRLA